jgi:hypothetical protein
MLFKRLFFGVIILLWAAGASAQLFSPVVTKPFSGVFGPPGTAPVPFFNQTAAVNYDYGGQGLGYNVPSPGCFGVSCVAGASTYRADDVNFKASTFGSGFNWQLGFNSSPDAYNYTISITQPGPYIITLWAGSSSSGGSWNVLIDKVLVGNVLTQNTGNYSTLAASSSPAFNATLGTHILTLAWASGDAVASSGDLVAWQGSISGASTPPPNAAAAGFTKPVVQADFTKPGNFWSTPANYMTNCGAAHSVANQPSTWHFTWSYQFTANELNCNASVSVVTDTAVTPNVQILKLQYLVSQFTTGNGGFGNAAALAFPNPGMAGTNTSWMPNEWYSKSVWRFDATTLAQQTGNETDASWSTNLVKEGGGCCFFDEDAFELPFYSSGTHPTGCSPTGITCACGQLNEWPGPAGNYSSPWFNTGLICVQEDFTQYHTFEYLATSDESTGVTICQWVDGTFNACASGALNGPANGNNDYLDRGRSILVQAMNAHAPTSNMTLYLQSFELWSCPNFASGTCPGSTFVNGGSSSPSYWH